MWEPGIGKLVYLRSFGCQQNVSDGEKMLGILDGLGYHPTDTLSDADLIIYNTCAVRENAENKVFGLLGELKQLKRDRPDRIIALCGCMAQEAEVVDRIQKSYLHVDLIFGTFAIANLPHLLEDVLESRVGRRPVVDVDSDKDLEDDMMGNKTQPLRGSQYSASVPVMYGCNNFCTYCIVPYVRGRERSRKPEIILSEVSELVRGGYKDIFLLGQNVNSYNRASGDIGRDFPWLLREINDIEGDFRIRFMTSHPKDVSIELIETIMGCKKVAKHLHLPIQSGSDRILEAMNRHYTVADYINIVNNLRGHDKNFSITTDIIVGFPGETEEDFSQTLSLCKDIEFESMYTFIYSKRTGTKAAKFHDGTSHSEKAERMNRLLSMQREVTQKRLARFLGKRVRILCEEFSGDGRVSGRCEENWRVDAVTLSQHADESYLGRFIDVEIDGASLTKLEGKEVVFGDR